MLRAERRSSNYINIHPIWPPCPRLMKESASIIEPFHAEEPMTRWTDIGCRDLPTGNIRVGGTN